MFSTNFCGLRSYRGNQLDWICTMIRWLGSNTWLTVGRVNLYSCVFPDGIAEGCSKLSRYRPLKISMATANWYPPNSVWHQPGPPAVSIVQPHRARDVGHWLGRIRNIGIRPRSRGLRKSEPGPSFQVQSLQRR